MDTKIVDKFRTSVPKPGAKLSTGNEFVGQDAGNAFSISVLQNKDETIAFVTNGKGVGVWLTGKSVKGQVEATGKNNEKLIAKGDGKAMKGSLQISGKTVNFILEPAGNGAGLKRAVGPLKGNLEALFIVTNNGRIMGGIQNDDRVAYSFHADTAEGSSSEPAVTDHTGGSSSDPVPLAFIRCSILVLKFHSNKAVNGPPQGSDPDDTGDPWHPGDSSLQRHIRIKFNSLGCDEYYTL